MIKSKLLNRIIQILLLAVIAYFLFPIFSDSFKKFNPADWQINYPLLILSIVLMQIVLYGQSAIWSWIITFFEKKISFNKAFRIAYLAQLGRYIPGKVWQLFGMIYLAGKEGVKKEEAATSFILSQLFATPPAVILVVLYLFIIEPTERYQAYLTYAWLSLVIVAIFLAIFFMPNHFRKIINFVSRLVRQNEVQFKLKKDVGIKILFSYFITWNLYGIAFYLFLISILPDHDFAILEIIGSWVLGYLIGYWTIVLPAGIGMREAVLIIMLTPIIGTDRAVIVVSGARLWSIVSEVIGTLIAWKIK